MNAEQIREYCISKPQVTECFPFDEVTLVFKVANKIFALLSIESHDTLSINLKCEPEQAITYREQYRFVVPGYHMNKKHWNTVHLFNIENEMVVYKMIDESYHLVVSGLSKKNREELML